MNNAFYESITTKLESGVGICLDIHSAEEVIVFENLLSVSEELQIPLITWDVCNNFQKVIKAKSGIAYKNVLEEVEIGSLTDLISFLRELDEPGLFVLLDIQNILEKDINFKRHLKCMLDEFSQISTKKLLVLGQTFVMPSDLEGRMEYYSQKLPSENEIKTEIINWIEYFDKQISTELFNKIVFSWRGITIKEGVNIVKQVGIETKNIGEKTAEKLYDYKVEKLKRLGIKISPIPEESVGGLNGFKSWFNKRKKIIFSDEDNMPHLKGVLICGIPGTGKSLIAKTIGYELNVPVFELQASNLLNSLVGESEAKTKRLLETIEASAPGVLLIDEIDKLFGGVGDMDGGSFQRVFGIFLSWLQNHKAKIYTVATANKTNNLPPELLRKGRFDEVFFVDLPSTSEREEITAIHLRKRFTQMKEAEVKKCAKHISQGTKEFSGSEISALIDSVAIESLAEKKKITFDLFSEQIKTITPLAVSKKTELKHLRDMNNFVLANDKEEQVSRSFTRKIN